MCPCPCSDCRLALSIKGGKTFGSQWCLCVSTSPGVRLPALKSQTSLLPKSLLSWWAEARHCWNPSLVTFQPIACPEMPEGSAEVSQGHWHPGQFTSPAGTTHTSGDTVGPLGFNSARRPSRRLPSFLVGYSAFLWREQRGVGADSTLPLHFGDIAWNQNMERARCFG